MITLLINILRFVWNAIGICSLIAYIITYFVAPDAYWLQLAFGCGFIFGIVKWAWNYCKR